MKYHVKFGDADHEVDVDPTADGLVLRHDGEAVRADVSEIEPGEKYSILLDGRSFSVSVDGDGRKLSLIVSGQDHTVEVEDERERAMREISGGGAAAGGLVESVMPGIVRKVDVEAGAVVVAGDRLLILEAMKMENEICAEADGVVEEVLVKVGDTVEAGSPLVSLAPAAAPDSDAS